jgi:hypothetical protein
VADGVVGWRNALPHNAVLRLSVNTAHRCLRRCEVDDEPRAWTEMCNFHRALLRVVPGHEAESYVARFVNTTDTSLSMAVTKLTPDSLTHIRIVTVDAS